jgi:dipeptidyl aminopeptidase/acylaminoacyl peptidase
MRDITEKFLEMFASLSVLGEWALSPDGKTIMFCETIHDVLQVLSMPLAGGFPRRLTATLEDCHEPQWSPSGNRIAYLSGDAIWIASASGVHARKLNEHPAGHSEPRWSPDEKWIAFYSRRRGWEQLWSVCVETGEVKRILKGEWDADDLAWSPDGKTLAFCSIRESDLMTRGIYLIPSAGGEEELISPIGCWSGAPHFSPDGSTLAFLSDRDGWFHIYLYDLNSRQIRQITHGEFEIGGPYFYNVDPHGGPIYSPDGRQIAFVKHRDGNFDVCVTSVDKDTSRRVSMLEGHYRIVGWLPDSSQLVVQFDNPANPPGLWVLPINNEPSEESNGEMGGPLLEIASRSISGSQIIDSGGGELNPDAIIFPDWVCYQARDCLDIHAVLYRPRGEEKKLPAVVFLHGGPNFEFANYFYPLPQLLAQEGYVVLAPNFRGSTGFGTAFRHANFLEWGHADAFDIVDGVAWLKRQEYVDPEKIAVVGPSYGGYLSLCALTLAPEIFCAGVDMYGDSEIRESYYHGDRHGRLDLKRQMGKPPENPDGYKRGSPFYFAEKVQAPLLILHGKEDKLVVPMMSEKMIEALTIEDKYFEHKFYEDEEHGFFTPENKKDAWGRVIKFLNKFCKEEKE